MRSNTGVGNDVDPTNQASERVADDLDSELTRICPLCGESFSARSLPAGVPAKRFCSPAHQRRWSNRRRNPVFLVRRLCIVCDKTFTTGDPRDLTCSTECAERHSRAQGRRRLEQSRANAAGAATVEVVWRADSAIRPNGASSRVHRAHKNEPGEPLCGFVPQPWSRLRRARRTAGPQSWEPRCRRCQVLGQRMARAAATAKTQP